MHETSTGVSALLPREAWRKLFTKPTAKPPHIHMIIELFSSPTHCSSIFDIEKSPFGGIPMDTLLAPIISPVASLSDDVSDSASNQLMAESAADVPLEPGKQSGLPFSVLFYLLTLLFHYYLTHLC